jgi:hypothetical protein
MPGDATSEPKPMQDMGNAGATKPEGANSPKASDKPSGEKNAGGSGQKPTPEQMKEFQDAVKDVNSKDPAKQKAAQDKLDNMVGEKNRKDIERDVKDFEKNVQNLQSKDDKTRKDAQDKLDKQVGSQNRKDIEDIQKGLNSPDKKERQKAEEKLKDLQAKAGAGDKQPQPKGGEGTQPPKVDPKDVEQAMKDLQSPDKATRDAAKEKLDKSFGKGAGDKAEQLQNDLKSEDNDKRATAEKELNDLKNKADQMAKNNPPKKDGAGGKKVDPKEVDKALDDIAGDDPAKREQAKKDLDDMLGKGTGDQAEKFADMAKSEDQAKQAQGRKGRDDILDKAEQMAKKNEQPKGKELSKEDVEKLAKNLEDLASKDEAKRKAAEQELDKQIGEPARKKLQEAAKDPKKAEELKKELEEMAKKGGAEVDDDGKINPKGGDPTVPVREAMKEDARNRAKSAELQLEHFEKNRFNKEVHDAVGMSQKDYDDFLNRFEKEVAKLKKEADDLEKIDPNAKPAVTQNIGQGSGKVDSKGKESGPGSAAGPTVAAPGYADALREFNKGATKIPPKK